MRDYGGVIWTDHVLERMRERGIKQGDAWATWKNPDNSRYAKAKGAWIYHKEYSHHRLEVVAKKNERGEWVILSVWSKPIYGEKNYSHQKDSFFKTLLKKLLNLD